MWDAANAVGSGLVLAAAVLVVVVVVGLTLVLAMAGGGLAGEGAGGLPSRGLFWLHQDTRLMLRLLRIMFPYLLLVCLAALAVGVLNARGHFFIPALGATMLNVVMIATVLFLAPRFGRTLETQIVALAVGVLLAGATQFAFQLPTLWREGFRYRWVDPRGNETVREVVRKMVPGTIGVAAFQINVLVIGGVAFWVDRNIVASFDYAVRLMEFPQGVVGISLATYLLPTLSGLAAEKRYAEFRSTLREGLGHLLVFNLLASVMLLVLAEPIVRLLFQHGRFSEASTQRAAIAVSCLAPGLVAFSVVNILARAFFALGDTQTPMKISIACLVLNLVFSLWLVGPFRQGGLGVANTMSSAFNVWLLLRALRRKLKRLDFESLPSLSLRLLGASALAALVAWGVLAWWRTALGHTTFPLRLGEAVVPLGLATVAYAATAWWLRVPLARDFVRLLRRPFRPERRGRNGE
jgi:putative peptidoglycan lipid II flippase